MSRLKRKIEPARPTEPILLWRLTTTNREVRWHGALRDGTIFTWPENGTMHTAVGPCDAETSTRIALHLLNAAELHLGAQLTHEPVEFGLDTQMCDIIRSGDSEQLKASSATLGLSFNVAINTARRFRSK